MKCPFCNSILENGYCKSCERQIHELYRHPKKAEHEENPENEEVIEPEIIDEEEINSQRNSQRAYRNFRQSPLFTQYAFTNVNMHDSCLTGIISFGLIFFVFLQMGFLAALGFAFFTFIGKIISLIISVKSLLKGKIISPIMLDVAIWIISYCLVTWLA